MTELQRLILVRHGSTALNELGSLMSSQNPDLSSKGEAQAAAVAVYLTSRLGGFSIVSSLSKRSQSTADRIAAASGLSVQTANGLQERELGRFEGLDAAELRAERRRLQLGDEDMTLIWDGVEGVEQDIEICQRFLAAASLAGSEGGRVCCVSHAGALKSVLHSLLDVPTSRPYAFRIGLGCAIELRKTRGRFELYSFWQNPHVEDRYLD